MSTRGQVHGNLCTQGGGGSLRLACTPSQFGTPWGMFTCWLRPTPQRIGPMLAVRHPSSSLRALGPKPQLDIFSAGKETGEAPTTAAALVAISSACGCGELPLWEYTDHQAGNSCVERLPLVISVHYSNQLFHH
uniref:Uncharacterized protein n=1 Tax=Pipistrellus kuhlii TaxID=59472 RepID=A0A7J8B210_PIPKU|nr:hypothetical protein mPipKuh1_007871 [Pipistrellus kuhlii]